jgi:hypothetical protein
VALAQTMLRAGYQTNGTPPKLRVMAKALRSRLTLRVCDAEAVALHVVRAAYPTTVGTPVKLRAMADVLRPHVRVERAVAVADQPQSAEREGAGV